MSHLVLQVLPEADAIRVEANLRQAVVKGGERSAILIL